MLPMNYITKLQSSISNSQTVLCVGLDPVPADFPQELRSSGRSENEMTVSFCRRVIEQTKTGAAAYKFNTAYFEALGADGFHVLNDILDAVPSGKVIIADAKRCDVPHTNARYKTAWFDQFGFDAITLSPFLGLETLTPFLEDTRHCVYALALTSNPGAADLMTRPFGSEESLSVYIAGLLRDYAAHHDGSLGMVIGATQPEYYTSVLRANPEAPLLIPGIGAQGGNIAELSGALADHNGLSLINVSRGISAIDPGSDEPWDIQVARNTDRINKSIESISQQYQIARNE